MCHQNTTVWGYAPTNTANVVDNIDIRRLWYLGDEECEYCIFEGTRLLFGEFKTARDVVDVINHIKETEVLFL